jgi:hypothetical protein
MSVDSDTETYPEKGPKEKRRDGAHMSDYICETCSEDARFVFVSLDTVISAACEEHRRPVVQRLVQLVFEPAHLASGVKGADLAQVRVEDYSVGMTVTTFEEPLDVPAASQGLGRELTTEEHIALLKERNAKAREAINTLVAENAQLRAELGRHERESHVGLIRDSR